MHRSLLLLSFLGIFYSVNSQAGLSFDDYWARVVAQNPTIAQQKAVTRSLEKNPSLEIPAPEISVSEMNENVPFGSSMGKMQRTVELAQSIPFVTKFSKANQIKKSSVSRSNQEGLLLQKSLKEEAFRTFLMYAKNQEMKKLMTDKLSAYQAHQVRSRALLVNSQEYRVHLLDVELEISSMRTEIKLIDIELVSNRAMLVRIMGESNPSAIDVVDLPSLSAPAISNSENLANHPMQKMNQFEIETMKGDLEMARLDWAPDIMLKLRNIKSYDSNVPGGKEIMVGISMPFIFPWQRNARNESLSFTVQSEEQKALQIKNQLLEEYNSLSSQLKEQWSLVSIYKEKSLPIMEKKLKLVHQLTTLDMESLDAHRMAIDQSTDLKLKLLEVEINYRINQFKLYELLNTEEGK